MNFAVQVELYTTTFTSRRAQTKTDKVKKRNYAKADYCYYCSKLFVSRISKHLLSVHRDKPEIEEALRYKPGKVRHKLLYKLQQLGNYQHNKEVSG